MKRILIFSLYLLGMLILTSCRTRYLGEKPVAHICGNVTYDNGRPSYGATVTIDQEEVPNMKNGLRYVSVDKRGGFCIDVPNGTRLKIQSPGYQSQRIKAKQGMRIVLKRNFTRH